MKNNSLNITTPSQVATIRGDALPAGVSSLIYIREAEKMKRVYVAGAYSADSTMGSLHNIRKGIRVSTEIFLMGYAPFSPWLDYQFVLMLRDGEQLSVEWFYKYSLAWLEVSDALYVLPDSEGSVGTQMEIKKAKEWGMPVFHNKEDLANAEL